jgi:hypothetical protein
MISGGERRRDGRRSSRTDGREIDGIGSRPGSAG